MAFFGSKSHLTTFFSSIEFQINFGWRCYMHPKKSKSSIAYFSRFSTIFSLKNHWKGSSDERPNRECSICRRVRSENTV